MASIVLLAMVAGQIKEAEPTVAVLASIGALGLALMATKASKAAFKIFVRPGKKLKKLGKWAVVTGKSRKFETRLVWDKCAILTLSFFFFFSRQAPLMGLAKRTRWLWPNKV